MGNTHGHITPLLFMPPADDVTLPQTMCHNKQQETESRNSAISFLREVLEQSGYGHLDPSKSYNFAVICETGMYKH